MNRVALHHLLCFVTGLAGASSVLWRFSEDTGRTFVSSPIERKTPAIAAAAPVEPVENPTVASPHERGKKLLDAALPVIRACSATERTARWSLLLNQLKREGDAGNSILSAFLATGEDLPLGPSFELPGIKRSGPSTLRMAVLDRFIWSHDKSLRPVVRDETLRSLQSVDNLSDAIRCIGNLEYLEPGAHRTAAIEAIERLVRNPATDAREMPYLAQMIARFGAVELLPLAEVRALAYPSQGMGDLFGSLWRVPADMREEITERILANPTLIPVLKDAIPKLDYRLPAAHDAAVAWFRSNQPTTTKAAAIERIGSKHAFGPSATFSGDEWKPDTSIGTPGTPAQAEARLLLLDEVAPFLSDPFLRESLSKARTALKQQIAGTR